MIRRRGRRADTRADFDRGVAMGVGAVLGGLLAVGTLIGVAVAPSLPTSLLFTRSAAPTPPAQRPAKPRAQAPRGSGGRPDRRA